MGRLRKGVGVICSGRAKVRKVPRAAPSKEVPPAEQTATLTIKIAACSVIRAQYHAIILPFLEKLSIKATKISELASFLFEYEKVITTGDGRILPKRMAFTS